MWHVPHLKGLTFCRAEMALRERAFDLRGTRFWRFVARFEGVKNGPILGQNDTYSTHADSDPAHPTYPAPPAPSPTRSCRILHHPTPFWSTFRNDQELLAERRSSASPSAKNFDKSRRKSVPFPLGEKP